MARSYVEEHRPVPPLPLAELAGHADNVIRTAGVSERYRDYITVLMNNAVWADALASVPFERRLLLLPQCLRDEERCLAALDEFGLLCSHCGNCPIHPLQTEAEKLGYVVLVAEGTTIAQALIETGKVEAIVGVSCLSSLERVFPLMEAGAIPGIAIPLLRDGCSNTEVDLDWVWDGIRLSRKADKCRLDLDALRAEVEAWFTETSLEEILGPATSRTEAIARQWLGKSGKRWRPFLAACVFQAFQQNAHPHLPADLRRIAVAVECFHKASLAHDDIEDHDPLRYGRKTLHEEYGIPIALNVGDFLLGEGYRMIAEAGVSADRKAEMLRVAASGHRSLCVGQGEELSWMRTPTPLSIPDVIEIFRQKTAPAFEVALRMGAVCAGANGDVCDVLHHYADALGIAYQIRDDLNDFWKQAGNHEAEAMGPSLLLAVAYQRASGEVKGLLEAIWRRPGIGAMTEKIEEIFADLEVEAAARRMLDTYQEQAIRALRPLDNADLKGLLRRVIGKIFKNHNNEG